MIDHTEETLKHWRSVPFSYENGEDCLMSLADHVKRVTGKDYGCVWRGTYCDEAEALMHVAAWGGPETMIDHSGLARTDEPRRGDIVVIDIQGKSIGGLYTGDSVALRAPRGVGEINAKFVQIKAAWRVE